MRKVNGFTLIELMLVVIIIGILISMTVPRLAGKSEQARKAAAEADIKSNISIALDMFELDNGKYPSTEEGLNALVTSSGKGPYLKKKKVPVDPWGRPYVYRAPGKNGADYDLLSMGADGAEGGTDDITNAE